MIGWQFPEWLEKNASALSSEDLTRHRQQLAHVQEICLLFEKSDPNSKAPPTRVIELMQEVRAFVRENGSVRETLA